MNYFASLHNFSTVKFEMQLNEKYSNSDCVMAEQVIKRLFLLQLKQIFNTTLSCILKIVLLYSIPAHVFGQMFVQKSKRIFRIFI